MHDRRMSERLLGFTSDSINSNHNFILCMLHIVYGLSYLAFAIHEHMSMAYATA